MKRNHGQTFSATTPASAALLLGQNPHRTALVCSSDTTAGGAGYWISTQSGMTAGQGVYVPPNSQALQLCACHVGDWIKESLFWIGSGAGSIIGFIEASSAELE